MLTIAGNAEYSGYTDGHPRDALFKDIVDMSMDKYGNIFVLSEFNNSIRKITQGGSVRTIINMSHNPIFSPLECMVTDDGGIIIVCGDVDRERFAMEKYKDGQVSPYIITNTNKVQSLFCTRGSFWSIHPLIRSCGNGMFVINFEIMAYLVKDNGDSGSIVLAYNILPTEKHMFAEGLRTVLINKKRECYALSHSGILFQSISKSEDKTIETGVDEMAMGEDDMIYFTCHYSRDGYELYEVRKFNPSTKELTMVIRLQDMSFWFLVDYTGFYERSASCIRKMYFPDTFWKLGSNCIFFNSMIEYHHRFHCSVKMQVKTTLLLFNRKNIQRQTSWFAPIPMAIVFTIISFIHTVIDTKINGKY